jgi:hypothetical protein
MGHRQAGGGDLAAGDVDDDAAAGAALAPGAGGVGLAGGGDEAGAAGVHGEAVEVAAVLGVRAEMKRGHQAARKLEELSTVARQENRVLTKIGRPEGRRPTSWAKTSPVCQVTCGT